MFLFKVGFISLIKTLSWISSLKLHELLARIEKSSGRTTVLQKSICEVRKRVLSAPSPAPPLFKSPPSLLLLILPFFQSCVMPPDKQYLFFKNFAFYSSVDVVENVTVKEILISVWFTTFIESSCLPNEI